MAKATNKKNISVVKEHEVVYRAQRKLPRNAILEDDKNSIIYWLGGKHLLKNPIRSGFDLFHTGSAGIPKASVDELAGYLGVSRKSMAEDILDLSVKTLERKSPADKLDKRTSSHALEIAKVMQHAYEVFEDEEKIRRWIGKENRALNGMKPLQLFDTLTGLNMVNDILGRIEEGVYS
ncbi:MAG TPA: antitoxin Xre/MbcA/ParS toxin-binding domain-containing protein [Flavisolibacter sp.]